MGTQSHERNNVRKGTFLEVLEKVIMLIKTKSMSVDTEGDITILIIEGHDPYAFSEVGLEFFKKFPAYLTEIATSEEEYDKLFIEFRNKFSKFIYDENLIKDLINVFYKKLIEEKNLHILNR